MSETSRPSYSTCDNVSPQCPVEATLYGDYFSKGPTTFFAISFGALLALQIWYGWKSKAWSFVSWLAVGTTLELAGYIGRVAMSSNPWNFIGFATQLLALILAPTFVAAPVSITFKYFVLHYGPDLSPIRPRFYPWLFVGSDLVSIVIQGAGAFCAAAATSNDHPNQSLSDASSGLLITGVSFQVLNMVVCGSLMLVYWRRYKNRHTHYHETDSARHIVVDSNTVGTHGNSPMNPPKARIFAFAITAAFVAIIIRCIYRVPEMASGWGSDIMKDEISFMILDGGMILISVLVLTVVHPYNFFPLIGNKKMMVELKENGIPMKTTRTQRYGA